MAGLRFTETGAVPHRPPARPRAGGRREDVEDQGQRHRPARGDPGVRRRRRAVHAGFGGVLGAHGLGRAGAHGRLAQLRDEGLECRALTLSLLEGRPPGDDLAGRKLRSAAGPLDPVPASTPRPPTSTATSRLSIRRGVRRDLLVRLARALRRVPRDGQAGPRGARTPRRGDRARRPATLPRGLGRAAASDHAVPDRGDLGEADRTRRARSSSLRTRPATAPRDAEAEASGRGPAGGRDPHPQLPDGARRDSDRAGDADDRSGLAQSGARRRGPGAVAAAHSPRAAGSPRVRTRSRTGPSRTWCRASALGLSLPRGASAEGGARIEKTAAAADAEIASPPREAAERRISSRKLPPPVVEKVRTAPLRARGEAGGARRGRDHLRRRLRSIRIACEGPREPRLPAFDPLVERARARSHRHVLRRGAEAAPRRSSPPKRSPEPTAATGDPGRPRRGRASTSRSCGGRPKASRCRSFRSRSRGGSATCCTSRPGVPVALKWPNDLYVGRRKLAGVITESRTQGDETGIAVGVGINVLGRSEALGGSELHDHRRGDRPGLPLAALLQALLERLDAELAHPRWEEEVRAWELASLHRPGDLLTIRRANEEVRGEYLGLDPSGFLRLKTEAGETIVVRRARSRSGEGGRRSGGRPAPRRRRRKYQHGAGPLARRRARALLAADDAPRRHGRRDRPLDPGAVRGGTGARGARADAGHRRERRAFAQVFAAPGSPTDPRTGTALRRAGRQDRNADSLRHARRKSAPTASSMPWRRSSGWAGRASWSISERPRPSTS